MALCKEDSDGDGMTNGQELGDPNCVWTEGTIPSRTDNITHPGEFYHREGGAGGGGGLVNFTTGKWDW